MENSDYYYRKYKKYKMLYKKVGGGRIPGNPKGARLMEIQTDNIVSEAETTLEKGVEDFNKLIPQLEKGAVKTKKEDKQRTLSEIVNVLERNKNSLIELTKLVESQINYKENYANDPDSEQMFDAYLTAGNSPRILRRILIASQSVKRLNSVLQSKIVSNPETTPGLRKLTQRVIELATNIETKVLEKVQQLEEASKSREQPFNRR
jgi:hypothetical protein